MDQSLLQGTEEAIEKNNFRFNAHFLDGTYFLASMLLF